MGGLELNLRLRGPLKVRVEGEKVDHPGACGTGEVRDGGQLGEVVPDQGHVEPERHPDGAQVVQRGELAGEVVPAAAVDLPYRLADPVDRHEEVVDAGVSERTGTV